MDALRERLPVQPDRPADLPGHDDLAVEHTAGCELVADRVEKLREVSTEVLAAARQQHDLVAVAEHQRTSS